MVKETNTEAETLTTDKPWYWDARWTAEVYGKDLHPTAIHSGHNHRVCFMPSVGMSPSDDEEIKRNAYFISQLPQIATERDMLRSESALLSRQLGVCVDALEEIKSLLSPLLLQSEDGIWRKANAAIMHCDAAIKFKGA